jgi:hypothetical protein
VLILATGMDEWASEDGTLPLLSVLAAIVGRGGLWKRMKIRLHRRPLRLPSVAAAQRREETRFGTPGGRVIAAGHPCGPPRPSSGTVQIFSTVYLAMNSGGSTGGSHGGLRSTNSKENVSGGGCLSLL